MSGPGEGPSAVSFDPTISDSEVEPHGLYRSLRGCCPVVHSDRFGGFWAVTRFVDVQRVLTEADTFITSVQNIVPRIAFTGRRPPLHLDPPEHTLYRRVLNPLMSQRRVAAVEPVVRSYADDCLDPMIGTGIRDFSTEFASRFSVRSFARFLNVSDEIMTRVETDFLAFNRAIKDDNPEGMREASLALYDLTRELIADRTASPQDPSTDPASALLAARVDDAPLPSEMVVGCLRQVLLVGIVAPRFVLGSFAVHLARDEGLQSLLRSQPERIPAAVEELLRLYSPYRGFARTARHDVVIGGQTISAGEPIAMVFTSANRDDSVFANSDEVVLDRPERHLAFGLGPHACPGASWARMELRIAMEHLMARTASFELCGPVEMTRWPEFGPESVPLVLHPVVGP